ncbi:MAG: TIGR00180 family glycosyltransferase [Chloroflexi bacterium]|nr:TIGR00180 family glycosyltransferase [Chloroflexota bacterium]
MAICNLIIPTFNRPDYLRRALGYYADHAKDFNIIVADSSSNEIKPANRKTISSISGLSIQYLDNYSTKINPHHKMADAVEHAEEKYCLFAADDDFVIPNGVRASMGFLEKNPGFAVAHGHYISFHLEEGENGKQVFWWAPVYSHESITSSDSTARFHHHLTNYSHPTIYAVHRTELLKMVYGELLKSGVDPVFFGELLPSMLAIIYSKLKCLDVFYDARDSGSIRAGCYVGDSITPGFWPTLRDALEAGVYDEEYAKFRTCLSVHLSKQSRLDLNGAGRVVDNAMSAYMRRYCPAETGRKSGPGKIPRLLSGLNPRAAAGRVLETLRIQLIGSGYANGYCSGPPRSSKYRRDFDQIRSRVLNAGTTSG